LVFPEQPTCLRQVKSQMNAENERLTLGALFLFIRSERRFPASLLSPSTTGVVLSK
jgi:hypothetical protein